MLAPEEESIEYGGVSENNQEYEDGSHKSKKQSSFLQKVRNPKQLGLAALSINLNNIVSAPIFLIFKIIDSILFATVPFFTIVSQIQQIQFKDMWMIKQFVPKDIWWYLLIAQLIMLFIFLSFSSIFIWLSFQITCIDDCKNIKYVSSKIASLLFAVIKSVIHLPCVFIITFTFAIPIGDITFNQYIGILIINLINCLLFLYILAIFNRICCLKIPLQSIPWTRPDQRVEAIKMILKTALCLQIVLPLFFNDQLQDYDKIMCILMFSCSAIYSICNVVMPHFFNKAIDFIDLLTCALIFSITFMQCFNTAFRRGINSVHYIFLGLTLPFIIGLHFVARILWKERVYNQMLRGHTSNQLACESALFIINEQMRDLKTNNSFEHLKQKTSLILAAIDLHNESCSIPDCVCSQLDSILWLVNRAQASSQQIIEINEEEISFLNHAKAQPLIPDICISESPYITGDYLNRKYKDVPCYDSQNNNEESRNPMTQQDEDQTSYMIDSVKLLQAFTVNYLKIYYNQAASQFPQSINIHFQDAYFTLHQTRNIFGCVNKICRFVNKNLSFVEKANLHMNQMYLILESQQILKNKIVFEQGYKQERLGVVENESTLKDFQSQVQQDQMNPEKFIRLNLLNQSFNQVILNLSTVIVQFWKIVHSKEFDVNIIIKTGQEVAGQIAKTFDLFNKIDQSCKQKDFKLYHNFGILQKKLLNDKQAYEAYMSKTKNIINIQKLLRNNYQATHSELDVGIVISSAYEPTLGKLILCNNVLSKGLGYQQNELKHERIGKLQPNLIRNCHNKLMKRFQQMGHSNIMNNNLNLFMTKKNGYIIPVKMLLKYHYSKDYGHIFIGFVTLSQEVELGKIKQKFRSDQVMYMLCGAEDGRIYDVSESVNNRLGITMKILHSNEVFNDKSYISILDICPNLESILSNDNCESKSSMYETTFDLNLNIISRLQSNVMHEHHQQNILAKCFLFKESYQKGMCRMTIAAIVIHGTEGQSDTDDICIRKQNSLQLFDDDEAAKPEIEDEEEELGIYYQSQSVTGSSQSVSQDKNSEIKDLLKDRASSLKQTTPRSLRIAVQLILAVFLIMVTISSINLYFSNKIQSTLKQEINIVKKSFDRVNLTTRARILLRGLLNQANGLGPSNTDILQNRFVVYKEQLYLIAQELQEVQWYLDNVYFDYSQSFDALVKEEGNLEYLNEDGSISYEQKGLSFAINLFSSRLLDIYNMNYTQMQGNMSFMSINPTPLGYTPTEEEKIIYFAVQNSLDDLRNYNYLTKEQYVNETKLHVESNKKSSQLTIIISICSILAVSIIVAPILSKITQRQYNAVEFYLELNQEQVRELVEKSESCHNMIRNQNKKKISKNKKKKSEIKRRRTILSELVMDEARTQNQQFASQLNLTQNNLLVNGGDSQYTQQNYVDNTFITEEYKQRDIDDEIIDGECKSPTTERRKRKFNKNKSSQSKENEDDDYVDDGEENCASDYNKREEEMNEDTSKNQHQFEQENNNIKELQKQIEIDTKIELEQALKDKRTSIQSVKLKDLKKTMCLCAFFAIVFSSYFSGSYFMQNRTYSRVPGVLDSLNMLFFKDACSEMLMADVRDTIIRNSSLWFYIGGLGMLPAVETMESYCASQEESYQNFRQNLPDAFHTLAGYIKAIDTEEMCDIVFKDDSVDKVDQCKQVYHGLLTKGLTPVFSYIYSYFTKMYDNFLQSSRSYSYNFAVTTDPNTLELIEMKLFILNKLFDYYKEAGQTESTKFFETLAHQYLIMYSCFIIVLILLLLMFVMNIFQKLRIYMWKTNLSLKILPIDNLSKDTQQKLKDFFNSQ